MMSIPTKSAFDSNTVTIGMGLPVLFIARHAQNCSSIPELVEYAKKLFENSFSLYVLKSLEFLRRGGRIGNISAFIAGVLKLHPILTIKDGLVVPLDKTRTFQKAIVRGVEHAEKHVAGSKKFAVAVIHMGALETGKELLEIIKKGFGKDAVEVFLTQSGPAIGTHAGPGSVGLATIRLSE
ncbi:MAG TPA: DegV family protein [Bellilinea sp.]|nr:DegV family protein [Bellilinea sp.]